MNRMARQAAEAEVERLREFQRNCLLPHEANDLGNDLDECRAEVERLRQELAELRELYADRDNDLLYEATGRRTAEDTLDKVRQALGVHAPVSVVVEVVRLQQELALVRDMLQDAPASNTQWYDYVCDYLETC